MHIMQDEAASLPRFYQCDEDSLTKPSQKCCPSGAKRSDGKTTKNGLVLLQLKTCSKPQEQITALG